MSKIALEGNASGTGTFTIAGPNTNTNYTITLPQETGTLFTTGATTGLNASALSTGTVATARLASGTANNTTFLRGDQTWAVGTSGPPGPPGPTGPTGPSGTPATTFNTVGSYCTLFVQTANPTNVQAGSTYAAGSGSQQMQAGVFGFFGGCGSFSAGGQNILSGTWRWQAAPAGFNTGYLPPSSSNYGIGVRTV